LWVYRLNAAPGKHWGRSVSDIGSLGAWTAPWQESRAAFSCWRFRCPQLGDCPGDLQQQTTKHTETSNCKLKRLWR